MADLVIANKDDLVSIANAIREKAESTDGLVFPAGFVEAISAIEVGGAKFSTGSITPASEGVITLAHELDYTGTPFSNGVLTGATSQIIKIGNTRMKHYIKPSITYNWVAIG